MKQTFSAAFSILLSAFFGVLLRGVYDLVDNLHYFFRIVSSGVVLDSDVVLIQEVVLIVLATRYLFDEILDLMTCPLRILLRVLVYDLRYDLLQALVQKLQETNIYLDLTDFVYLLTRLLNVQKNVL